MHDPLSAEFPDLGLLNHIETPQRLSQVFRCGDGGVTNAITSTLQHLPPNAAREMGSGVVVPMTEDFAAHYADGAPVTTGRSYQWAYIPRPARIEGICTSDFYPDGKTRIEQTTRLDMSLEPGWNLLEVEVTEIGSLSEEMTFALGRSLRTVEALPAEARWFSWRD